MDAPEMELCIHTSSGGEAFASGRFMPRKPRDIGQFRPLPPEGPSFTELQDELQRLEELAVEEAATARAALGRKGGHERGAGSRQPDEGASKAPPRKMGGAAVGGGAQTSGKPPPARRPPAVPIPSRHAQQSAPSPPQSPEAGLDDVVVHCEDPDCKEQLVMRAVKNRPQPVPPEGNWFCLRCTSRAGTKGIKLFERVLKTRQLQVGERKLTQYLVRYWGYHEDDDEWLTHEEMQKLEVSCRGLY
ncbi:hypothetical protein T492DRAFT_972399 [Pavlovales sp. CCMP2436]|nr:hypothetical protein T492DRAFT_972399 [Pavlovales sp. CCMP2436]